MTSSTTHHDTPTTDALTPDIDVIVEAPEAAPKTTTFAELGVREEIVRALAEDAAGVVRAVLSETGHSQFVVAEVKAAVTASDKQRHRLALWSRRLLGEAITQAQYVLAEHDALVDFVVASGEGLGRLTEFFDRLQNTHNARVRELGLA